MSRILARLMHALTGQRNRDSIDPAQATAKGRSRRKNLRSESRRALAVLGCDAKSTSVSGSSGWVR